MVRLAAVAHDACRSGRPLVRCLTLTPILALALLAGCTRQADLAGAWDGQVEVGGVVVPFRFELVVDGPEATGFFFDGSQRIGSSGGRVDGGQVTLEFEQFGTRLEAALDGGVLEGVYDRGTRGQGYPFRATRPGPVVPPEGVVPAIAGTWRVPVESSKGERAWRFIVRQDGPEVAAAILRVDGDTGTLSGRYQDGRFLLSHFSGARPTRLEVTVQADGTLRLVQDDDPPLTAVRDELATAEGVAEPTDPASHTRVTDPSVPIAFSFPDLDGHVVSHTDARFRGKVVIISITGSWCPNCHDETPFLVDLYRRYRDQGLEIVALSFEEAAQLEDPVRLRAFIRRYGIEYTVLLAGEPAQLAETLPQAENLNAFPTTFYVGRDGLPRHAHAGFPSPASGEYYDEARAGITAQVEALLAEGAPAFLAAGRQGDAPAAPSSFRPSPTGRRLVDAVPGVTARPRGGYDLWLDVTPKPGMHVYAPGATGYLVVSLSTTMPDGATAAPPVYPPGEPYFFEPLRETVLVYEGPFRVSQAVTASGDLAGATVTGTLSYQACDDRLCYAPQREAVTWVLPR